MTEQLLRGRRRAMLPAAAAVIALLGSAACSSSAAGSDDPPSHATSHATSHAGSHATTHSPTPPRTAAKPDVLKVSAQDSGETMSYTISGSPHAGLVEIDFTNNGDDAHEMGLARVKDGVTLAQIKSLLLSHAPDAEKKAKALQVDPDTEIGGPAIVGPGLSEKVTLPLPAGHYILTCFLPGEHGMPHVAMGMIGEFTVLDAAADAPAAPSTDGTITLTDHSIALPGTFAAGGTFAVTNTGRKLHDFSVAKLAGKPLPVLFQCVGASLGKGKPIDTCPGTLAGGVMTVQPGKTVYVALQLAAGSYGYLSTQGNGADVQAGLVGTFSVK